MWAIAALWAATQGVTEAYDILSAPLVQAHVEYLAADALEGRGAGARGGELAARYIAAQFRRLGLQPAGDAGTYFQRVPLQVSVVDEGSELAFRRGSDVVRLGAGAGWFPSGACPAAETRRRSCGSATA